MPTLLVIEDDPEVLDNITEILTETGYQVLQANNGKRGIAVAQEQHPDLIICDIIMPHASGHDVLRALRADPDTTQIPLIFLTAMVDQPDQRKGMNLGAEDYIAKPFSARELLASVKTRLTRQEAFRARQEAVLEELRQSITRIVPHEFFTPLTTILGGADLILDPSSSFDRDQIRELAGFIHQAGLRLKDLVENYILYVQLELQATRPDSLATLRGQQTSLAATLVKQYATAASSRHQRSSDLVLDLDESAVGMAPEYLAKIVDELVDNACKFSPIDTPVHVKVYSNDSDFVLKVTDEGRGMSAHDTDRIGALLQFDRDKHEQQGSGMGLALVSRLAELHGGRMTIESQPDNGATVILTLPKYATTQD